MNTNEIRNFANMFRFMSNRYGGDDPYGGDYSKTPQNSNAARPSENPERFLAQPYNPFEYADGQRARIRQDNQEILSLGNQSRNDELSRQRTVQAMKDDSATRQNREAIYRSQEEANINNNAYARKLEIEKNAKPVTFTIPAAADKYKIFDDATIAHNRQLETMKLQQYYNNANAQRDSYNQRIGDQMRRSTELQMGAIEHQRSMNQSAAQNAAQERLARINQQTAILGTGTGESGWRWF